MSWWGWLLMLAVWAAVGIAVAFFLGSGIGEADRCRARRRADPTPEDITGPGDRPGREVPEDDPAPGREDGHPPTPGDDRR